jgi:hypothetical protein
MAVNQNSGGRAERIDVELNRPTPPAVSGSSCSICRESSPELPGTTRTLRAAWTVRSSPGRRSCRGTDEERHETDPSHLPHRRRGDAGAPGGAEEDTTGGFAYGGWLVPFADQDMGTIVNGWFEKADAILLGRSTYDAMFPYWSQVSAIDRALLATSA